MEIGKNMLNTFQETTAALAKPESNDTSATTDTEPQAEPAQETPSEPAPTTEPQTEPASEPSAEPNNEPTPLEFTDEAVINYLKEKKGKEVKSLDELFKEPEPVADPYESLTDEAKQFLNFNKDTGRGYNEYLAVQKDLSQANPAEVAREKAISISDGYLNRENVDEYLTEELGIDITDFDSMSPIEKMKLKNYGSDYLKSQQDLQQKYKQPSQAKNQTDMVTLENGQKMPRETYNQLVEQQKVYQDSVKKASDNIKASNFEVKIDNNGTEKVMNLDYEYSKDDVHDMTSSALNIDQFYQKAFGSENGLDYAKLQEGLHWANPEKRGKSITAIVHKALAKQAEEFTEMEYNAGVKTKSMPKGNNSKSKIPVTSFRGGVQNQGIGFSPEDF